MSRFENKRKRESLAKIARTVIENSEIESKCKFNFSYFDSTPPSTDFEMCSIKILVDLLNRIKEFTKEPLQHWIWPWEKHNSPLEIYGKFPSNSKTNYEYPIYVPADVKWARFRIDAKTRLIGFIIPDELHNKKADKSDFFYDKNTFYVVFLDLNYEFWISDKKGT